MITSPDGIERSRASANCAGSYLHSPWWLAQTSMTYAMPGQLYGPLNGLGGLMGGLGQSLGQLGNSLGNLFGKP